MSYAMSQTGDEHGVRQAEKARCEALERDDFAALRKLISPDIVHTHTRGNTDNFDSFFEHIQNRIRFVQCRRGPLSVRIIGAVAIMTGPMQNVVRLRDGDEDIPVSAQVMQAWEWQGDRWVLLAFQATSLPQNG
jgi:hypothetical protein